MIKYCSITKMEVKLEELPVEMLSSEIGEYLDISSMISMSFVCKDFQDIYQSRFQKIVNEIDPYIKDGNIHDFLRISKVGPSEYVVYKIWKSIFDSIIKEMEYIYPSIKRKHIMDTFVKVIPIGAINNLKDRIRDAILSSDIFISFRGVLYKNPYSFYMYDISEMFETEIIDMIDGILHEFSSVERISRENSFESRLRSTSSESLSEISSINDSETSMEYFPYDNVTDSIENVLRYL
jgi:hypothetical protein